MEGQTNKQNQSLPPPPPLDLFNLAPPTIKYESYTRYFERKQMAIINGQSQFASSKQQVSVQLKKQLQKSQLGKVQSQSIGQVSTRNLEICFKCQKCGHWIENTERRVHMSCHAAKIIDGLLLGDKNCSMSKKELIQRNQVTHIVNAASELDNYLQSEGIKYCNLDLADLPGQDLIPQVLKAASFIKAAMDEGGVVFVHCAVGKSRSVSAIIMYLMLHHQLNYQQSLDLIKEQRPIARPNPGYIQQLKQYYDTHLKQQE